MLLAKSDVAYLARVQETCRVAVDGFFAVHANAGGSTSLVILTGLCSKMTKCEVTSLCLGARIRQL